MLILGRLILKMLKLDYAEKGAEKVSLHDHIIKNSPQKIL